MEAVEIIKLLRLCTGFHGHHQMIHALKKRRLPFNELKKVDHTKAIEKVNVKARYFVR